MSDSNPEILKAVRFHLLIGVFTLFNETRQHIKSNHHDQYCGQCDAVFLTKEDNIRHHTTVHETATKQDCVKDTQTEATIWLVRTPDLIAFS